MCMTCHSNPCLSNCPEVMPDVVAKCSCCHENIYKGDEAVTLRRYDCESYHAECLSSETLYDMVLDATNESDVRDVFLDILGADKGMFI